MPDIYNNNHSMSQNPCAQKAYSYRIDLLCSVYTKIIVNWFKIKMKNKKSPVYLGITEEPAAVASKANNKTL